jgi:CheY-like chemotaxis protein
MSLADLNVLCIDNDIRILEGMRLLLEGWGCNVAAFSGWQAFKAGQAGTPPPDVILADYHLDGENGLDVIEKLRKLYGIEIPAMLVTADRSSEVRSAADALDIAVINKPLKPAVLRTMMARARPMATAD